VKEFQQGAGLTADGIVGPSTRAALPDGGPMPTLQEGSSGAVVRSLQRVLTNGAAGQWHTTPQGIDGVFGPHIPARPSRPSKAGAASRPTESSATKPVGLTPCRERHAGNTGRARVRNRLRLCGVNRRDTVLWEG
jgi:Putative peptidoglycan binding domain